MLMARDYQKECGDMNAAFYQEVGCRGLNVLPTGTCKTHIAAWLYGWLGLGRMLWVAHREELIDQAEERMQQLNPGPVVEVEQAGRQASPKDDIVIASINSIHQSKRLERLGPDSFGILALDECHHGVAKMWLNLLHRFKLAPEASSIPGRAFTGREFRDTAGAHLRTFQPDSSAPYLMGFTVPSPPRSSGGSPR